MNEECLDKVVDRAYLLGKGFRQRGTKFYRVTKSHVVCYYEIAKEMYAVDYAERFERHVLGREDADR